MQETDKESVPDHAGLAPLDSPEPLRPSEEPAEAEDANTSAFVYKSPEKSPEEQKRISQPGTGSARRLDSPSSSSLVNVPLVEDAKAEDGDDSEPLAKSADQGEESYERANEGDDSEAFPKPDREADQHYDKGHDADDSLEQIREEESDDDPKANEADDSEPIPAPDKEVD